MKGNRDARIAKLEQIKAFNQAAVKNLEAVLTSALETDESRKKARRELLTVMEKLVKVERKIATLMRNP
jgi:uncharacterized coiled-coil protein SlyX